MAWVFVICAGIFEIVGVIGMNGVARAKTPRSFATLFIGFAFSFTLLNLSLQTLPMGVSYAVWTGIGAAGATLVGMLLFKESKDWKRILFISFIIIAVIGLKLTS